jgi:hypothetical protein
MFNPRALEADDKVYVSGFVGADFEENRQF